METTLLHFGPHRSPTQTLPPPCVCNMVWSLTRAGDRDNYGRGRGSQRRGRKEIESSVSRLEFRVPETGLSVGEATFPLRCVRCSALGSGPQAARKHLKLNLYWTRGFFPHHYSLNHSRAAAGTHARASGAGSTRRTCGGSVHVWPDLTVHRLGRRVCSDALGEGRWQGWDRLSTQRCTVQA